MTAAEGRHARGTLFDRHAHPGALRGDERGSTIPLLLGYLVLAITLIYVCVCATDLYIAQKRLDSMADAAALAGADGFRLRVDGAAIRAELDDAEIAEQAAAVIAVLDDGTELVTAGSPDGFSARVTVRTTWAPPLFSDLVPSTVTLRATGTSRTALE